MNENVLIAIISSSSAIVGGFIGGLVSMWSTKKAADREDERRNREIERKTAADRITKLYDPLLSIITPGPPYDEFYIEDETKKRIIDIINQNELYASPDLLNFFWEFRRAYYGEGNFSRDLDWEFFELIYSEHAKLKEMIGYGTILNKNSWIKSFFVNIKSKTESILSKIMIKMPKLRKKRRRRI